MATTLAPQTIHDLKDMLKDDTKIKVAVDGILRGKYMSKEKFLSAASSSDGFGFCSVVFGWDMHDQTYSRELLISNKSNGYRDLLATIDLSTFRRIPWEGNVPFFLVAFADPDSREPLFADPRSGRECFAGVEFEYFNFKETAASLAEKGYHNLQPLTPGMHGYSLLRTQLNDAYFQQLFDDALKFEVPVEGHHTETGPGVLETALAYTSALRMADNAALFKYVAKSVGMKHGVVPSFMAKPWGELPGCSGHIHVSMRDSEGKNTFAVYDKEGRADAAYPDTKFVSQEGEWFLAGVLDALPDTPLVPTINGYKRLAGGAAFWAPNAVTWGYDSRAASIRLIAPPSVPAAATRLEVRVPGADVQAHFAMSAIIMAGLRGVKGKMALPKPITAYKPEDRASGKVPMLPLSLEEATRRMMREGSIAREECMFGDAFVDHFGGTREHEVALWNAAVTNWEVERYLELA
ncbi:hypothetical protein BD626DRAFT_497834 [Schizophyllum amplum]|uniref:GS catalytic domain-containing protein n=1 Tax=Schizophyllum amplum TaxID=97359 RepID=A0A550CCQ2_9AGAR|nr:hypothetical protein BD626DRAFT_497834 [Auriculariopsis ampla]